jgi:hypothetical protein
MGYVYLLLQVNAEGLETYKIGVTKNDPELRVKQLQTGNPNKISVLRVYESDNYLKVERWMHRKYFDSKTEAKNEWRNLTNEQIISFLDDCKAADEIVKIMLKENPFYK